MSPDFPKTQVCTWVFVIDQVGPDTYALQLAGEVSLVDAETLKKLIQQLLGEHRGLGGDDVAGA